MADQESFLLRVANQVRDHLSVIGRDYRYLAVNEAYARASGQSRDGMVGSSVADLIGEEVFESIVRPKLDECFGGRDVRYRYDFRYPGHDDKVYMDVSYFPYRNGQGEIIGAAVSARDVTALKRIEDRFARMAHFDTATNLSNRLMFERELDRSLARARREKSRYALLHLELDGLGALHEQHDDDRADQVLKEVANRLHQSIRQNDMAARLAADEFAVLGESVGDEASVLILASRLSENLSRPFEADGASLSFPVRIGVAIYPDDGDHRNGLLKQASDAMHKARFSSTSSIMFAHEF